jgi:hypothetical protein
MKAIQEQMALVSFSDPQQFVAFIQNQGVQPKAALRQAVTTDSRVFRVTSSGVVNEATVTIDAVIDYSSAATGKIVYWRIR